MNFKTEQESFWAGEFGDEYIFRNNSEGLLASNIHFFSPIINRTGPLNSCLELGANIGMNLHALSKLVPKCNFTAVEINKQACVELRKIPNTTAINASILDLKLSETFDLVFTKGVLIHINPDFLPTIYDQMYKLSNKYICVAEYFNPSPVTIPYRGHNDRLFKRDFAGDLLMKYSDLSLVDYGFAYNRDRTFPQDNITWFLLEKTK